MICLLFFSLFSCQNEPSKSDHASEILSARLTAYIKDAFIMDLITESASFYTRDRQGIKDHTISGYMKVTRLITGEENFNFLFDMHAFDTGLAREKYDLSSNGDEGRASLRFMDLQNNQVIHHFISSEGNVHFENLSDKQMIGRYQFFAYDKNDPSRTIRVTGAFHCQRR